MRFPHHTTCVRTLLLSCVLAAAGHAQSYDVVPLGALPQQSSSVPWGINSFGDVTGWSILPGNQSRAFVYTDAGGMVDIGVPFGNSTARGRDINDSGQVTGASAVDGFVFTPGSGFQNVGSLASGPAAFTEGWGINNRGTVCGASGSLNIGGTVEGFRWTPSTGIVSIVSGSNGRAQDINGSGQITGWTSVSAYRFTPGSGTTFLPTLPNLPLSFGWAINDLGDVAGIAKSSNGNTVRLFRFTDAGGIQDLGTVGQDGEVGGINNSGVIVGSADFSTDFAFLYTDQGGLRDLNTMIPLASGWHLTAAHGINESGQIICIGSNPAFPNAGAVRLDPRIPAASTPVGAGCGGMTGGPMLSSASPVLGQPVALTLTNGTPSAFGLFAISPGSSVSMPLGQGCTVYVDLDTAITLLTVTTDGNGSWNGSLSLPRVPYAAGWTFTAQAGLAQTPGPLGIDLTNGVEWTLGY